MIEKTFLNPATNKQWRIEIDGHTIRTCLNGGKVKEILCDSAFQVKSKAASAMMGRCGKDLSIRIRMPLLGRRGATGLLERTTTVSCPWLPLSHGMTSS